MKASVLAILLLLPLQRTVAQTKNDLANEGLKGKVKMVTEWQYYKGQKGPSMKTTDKYDVKGYLIEEVHDDYELKLATRKYLKYDTSKDGYITRLNEFNDSEKPVHTIDYRRDSQNHIVEEKDNRRIGNDTLIHKNEFDYDSTGNRIRQKSYADTTLIYSTDYCYDRRGRITKERSYDKNNKETTQYEYYYMTYNQWVHCEKRSDSVRTHFFRALDTAGIPIEQTTYTNDYSKEKTETYTSFDKYGNWLMLIVKGTISEHYYIKRTIEYYK